MLRAQAAAQPATARSGLWAPQAALGARFSSSPLWAPWCRQDSNPARQILLLPPMERIKHIKLMVCDMAGTTVDEGGLVYITLQKVMNDAGLEVTDEEMIAWHGAQKTEVVAHFVNDRMGGDGEGPPKDVKPFGGDTSAGREENNSYDSFRPWSSKKATQSTAEAFSLKKMAGFIADKIDQQFEVEIQEAYFAPDSPTKLIHEKLPEAFENLRLKHGIKIALNTGYPSKIQKGLIDKLGLAKCVDAWVCAGEVGMGRPYPYMMQLAMQRTNTLDASTVAKFGDTSRDMEEGLNGGCGLAVGVLSGAAGEDTLMQAGADLVINNVVDFEGLVAAAKS